jgi:hypothetical protein
MDIDLILLQYLCTRIAGEGNHCYNSDYGMDVWFRVSARTPCPLDGSRACILLFCTEWRPPCVFLIIASPKKTRKAEQVYNTKKALKYDGYICPEHIEHSQLTSFAHSNKSEPTQGLRYPSYHAIIFSS